MEIIRSLVLDQATCKLGFAIVDHDPHITVSYGVNGRLIQHGRIVAPKDAELVDRLRILRADLRELLDTYKPHELVIENTMNIPQRTGQTSHALSAIFALCQELAADYQIGFYTQHPGTIKERTTGNGNADKKAVIDSVMWLWGLSRYDIKDDNHADALAGAYTWLYRAEAVRAEVARKKAEKAAKKGKSRAATP